MRIFRLRRSGEDVPIMPFESYLRDMDVDAYADTLLASVPSLKEVQVSVRGSEAGCVRQADRRRTEPDDRNTVNASSHGSKDETT